MTADSLQVISLRDLSLEIDIPEDEELEEFIIEAIRMNAISVRLLLILKIFLCLVSKKLKVFSFH